MVKSVIQK